MKFIKVLPILIKTVATLHKLQDGEYYPVCQQIIQYGAMFFEVHTRAFVQLIFFPGTFIYFRFMTFTQILMKDSAHMLIHVHNIFNCRESFEMMLSRWLVNCWEGTSNIAAIKRLSKCHFRKNYNNSNGSRCHPFLPLVLNKKKKK